VPGLHLHRCGPVPEAEVETAAAEGDQLVRGRVAGRLDGGEDAAARGGDLLVGGAGDAARELLLPRAGEEEVGVGVDEAGHADPAPGVQPAAVLEEPDRPARLGRPSDPDGPPVERGQGAALDHAERALAEVGLEGEELTGPDEEEVGRLAHWSAPGGSGGAPP